jgi:hypothetical protein
MDCGVEMTKLIDRKSFDVLVKWMVQSDYWLLSYNALDNCVQKNNAAKSVYGDSWLVLMAPWFCSLS